MIFKDAWRSFKQDRLTAGLALVSLALGLATATVTLTIVDMTLLHPLPYPAPEKIVEISQPEKSSGRPRAFSYRFFYDSLGRLPGIQALSPLSFSDQILDSDNQGASDPVVVTSLACSASLFDVLRLDPLRGRLFDQDEALPGAGSSVALISEELWRGRYSSDPNILGKRIRLNELPFTVIGVMKAGLRLPPTPAPPAVWIPLGSDPILAQVKKMFPSRWDRSAYLAPMWARVASSHSVGAIEEQLRATGLPLLAQDDPESSQDADLRVVPLVEQLRNKYGLETRGLILAALLVLMVSCFNISSLILTRSLSRRTEIAVRVALGESQLRVATRVLFEGMLISLLGASLGILAARLVLNALASIIPNGLLPYRDIVISADVLILSMAVAAGGGIGVSIWPAVSAARLTRGNLLECLHRSSTEGRPMKLNRQVLVAAQVGCAVLALTLFVCLFRTYRNISATRLGFDADPVLIANLRLPQNVASGERWKGVGTLLIDDLGSQEGVASAAIALSPPVTRSLRTSYAIAGATTGGLADYRAVGPDYFTVLGIPLLNGRSFSRSDTLKAPRVCIISDTLARTQFVEGQEIGALIKPAAMEPFEVVGVAGDVVSYNLKDHPAPTIYVPFDQMPGDVIQGFMTVLVRTTGNASNRYQVSRLAQTIKRAAPTLPANIQSLATIVAERSSTERFRALLMGAVSLVAVVLAACGIYGTAANYVVQGRREMTIRLALGATNGRVIGSIVKNTLVLAAAGLVLGLSIAYPLLKALSAVLYGLSGLDATGIMACVLFIPLLASLSAYIPSRRVLSFSIADVLKET
jgi:putative ABC transport system permease protein